MSQLYKCDALHLLCDAAVLNIDAGYVAFLYKIPLLLLHKISHVEYFRLWPSLPAMVEFTGTYTYEGSGFKATDAQQYDATIIKEVGYDLQSWCDDLTDGGVKYMPEEEVKVAAAERLRSYMKRIAILKVAQAPPKALKIEEETQDDDDN
nr:protein TPLATE [Tanacetum cinerariifolium]